MDNDLDTLATALYVTCDDYLKARPELAPWRPRVGLIPRISDAELITLAVMQALLEHTTVISFVCHDHLPRRNSGWGGIEDPLKGVTFVGFCAGEREPDRQPVERGEQVQAHTPEESGMRSAVSVLGEPGKV